MTKDEALNLALEALEKCYGYRNHEWMNEAITDIKEALANDTSQERVDETSKNVHKPCGLECDCTDVCKQVDYKALWQQMCERCDELDKRLSQSEQAPMNYYRADAKGNLERTDIHSAQPEQDLWAGATIDERWYITRQPEQEPVAWAMYQKGRLLSFWMDKGDAYNFEFTSEHSWSPLYTSPPQRTWVGLTDAEMKQTCYEACSYDPYTIARAIEAKLKEKNT